MSRIHEALKKAEQDRSVIQSPEAAPSAEKTIAPAEVAPVRMESEPAPTMETATAEALAATAPVPEMTPANTADFGDLLAHCAHPRWNAERQESILLNSDMGAYAAEQFRTLRSRLYHIRGNQQLRTVLVTSAIPKEGKTWVTSNLAQAIVRQVDRRALIIDADLRGSSLHISLGAPSAPGLTDYLKGEADERAIIQHGAEGNLYFIAGGNEVPNPSELLSNGRLKALLERVTPIFDWVILDSPPWLSVADASILAGLCDGVLLVVRAGVTPAAIAEKAHEELAGRNVIGIVLNAVDDSQLYGGPYNERYGSYGKFKGPSNGNATGETKISS